MTELTTEIVQMIFDKGYEAGLEAGESYTQGMHDSLTEHFKIVPKSFDEDEKAFVKAPEGETLSVMATMVCDALPDLPMHNRKCFADLSKAAATAGKYIKSPFGTFWIHRLPVPDKEQYWYSIDYRGAHITSIRVDSLAEAYQLANDKYREIARSLFEEFDRAGV